MKKIWIVVANSSYSKILRAENVHTLVEHQQFAHPESHLKASDLVSDNRGRSSQRMGYFSDTMEETTPLKKKEAIIFANEISKYLEEAYNTGNIDYLYLIANPPFLSYLKDTLNPNIAKIIKAEIQKDLTQLTAKEIREYLPLVL